MRVTAVPLEIYLLVQHFALPPSIISEFSLHVTPLSIHLSIPLSPLLTMTMMTSIILVLVYLVVTHGFVRFATTTTHNSFRLHQSTPTTLVEDMSNVAFIVLAGGTGSRMKATMPKQFLSLRGIPILHYSLHLLLEELPIYCQGHDIR